MSSYKELNKKKLIRRSESALHIASDEKVVEVARTLGLKVPKMLECNNIEDIKKLIRKIFSLMHLLDIPKVVQGAKILDVKIPRILLKDYEEWRQGDA